MTPTITDILRHILTSGNRRGEAGVAIDVGAHVGAFANELLEASLFEAVIAFEPNPSNLPQLLELATRRGQLTVVACAVGATAGPACRFHCDEDTATGSLLPYRDDYENRGLVTSVSVPVTTLDEYRATVGFGGTRLTLLKVDTQGQDLAVLRGASVVIAAARPLVIAELIYLPMYVGQASPEEISSHMASIGYRLYTLFNIHASVEGCLAFADALFVPEEDEIPISQRYVQLDDHVSLRAQIAALEAVCAERLVAINVLDAEVKRLSR